MPIAIELFGMVASFGGRKMWTTATRSRSPTLLGALALLFVATAAKTVFADEPGKGAGAQVDDAAKDDTEPTDPGAETDLPPPPLPEDPSMFGQGLDAPPGTHNSTQAPNAREAAEDALPPGTVCPDGMVPVMLNDLQVLDLNGQPLCKPPHHPFIKGELTNLGATKLKLRDSRFGIGFGYAHLDGSSYLHVEPQLDMNFGKFSFGIGVPLNFRAYANGFVDGGGIHLRANDYSSASDFARVIRFITYGAKEDNVYLNISQLFAASIGHGTIVRRYSGEIDQNITRVGAQLDAYGRFGGFEAFIGDVVQPTHFMSGLAFLKPLGFISGSLGNTLGQTSIGLQTALDLHAPFTLNRIPGGYPSVGDDGEPVVGVERSAQIIGADLETKILKTDSADIKPFLDYSRMLDITDENGKTLSGGGGLTLGLLGRFNVGDVKVHAFRVIAEGRYFDGNYQPGYFDTFYEVQKYQYISGAASTSYDPKLRSVFGTNDLVAGSTMTDNQTRAAQKRLGFYAEFGYQFNEGLALMLAYEDSYQISGPATVCPPAPQYCNDANARARNFTAHLEYPVYSWFQFFASFYKHSFTGSPFDFVNGKLGDNVLIYAAARVHILPILFLNIRYYRSWQADPVLGQMTNVPGFEADLEFGYEFDRNKKSSSVTSPKPHS
jgi:hypothetical protein